MYRVRGRNFDIALGVITPKRLNEIICPTIQIQCFSRKYHYFQKRLNIWLCTNIFAWVNMQFEKIAKQSLVPFSVKNCQKLFFSQIVRKLGYKGFLGCRIHFWCPFWKISSFWGNSRTILQKYWKNIFSIILQNCSRIAKNDEICRNKYQKWIQRPKNLYIPTFSYYFLTFRGLKKKPFRDQTLFISSVNLNLILKYFLYVTR